MSVDVGAPTLLTTVPVTPVAGRLKLVGGYLVDFDVGGQNTTAAGVCNSVACTTDAVVTAADGSGNSASARCNVPPPPK